MKKTTIARLLGLLLIALPGIRSASAAEGGHVALVIGNAQYASLPALPACAASAHLVTAALKRAGFDVTERLDRSNGQMSGDLAALAAGAEPHPASIVVYVCAYATSFDGRPFLLPVSAAIERDSDALTQGLVAKSVIDAARRAGASAILVLIDAIARPNSGEKLSFAALMNSSGSDAVAAATTNTPPPQAGTAFAAGLGAVLTPPDIESGALLKSLQQRLAGSGIELAIAAPSAPAWLAGGQPATVPAQTAAAPQPAAAESTATRFPDEAQMSDADRRSIQSALAKLGYYDGRVDGVFGPDTRAAIRRFQHEIKTAMTGKITPEEASRLLASSGAH
jgi:hypothetical protein